MIVGAEGTILILDLKTQAAVTIIEGKYTQLWESLPNYSQQSFNNCVSSSQIYFYGNVKKKSIKTKFLLTGSSANTQTWPLYTTVCTHTYTETGSQTGYALQTRYKS